VTTLELARALLAALIALTHPPRDARRRIDANEDSIIQAASDAADLHSVPVGIVLGVGFLETHLGTDAGEGGGFGAPVDSRHRHTAGTAANAAHILSRGHQICGPWIRAIHFFRCGRCSCPRLVGYESPYATRLVERVYESAGVEAPPTMR